MRVRLRQDRLSDLIAKSGLTQNHWAIRLGLSRGHWSGIVNGKHPYPSARTRTRLLEAFAVPFDDLFAVETGPSGWSDQDFQAAIADRYLIDREIGQGGMGTVYLARDVKHGRQVAVKVISPEAVSGIGVQQFLKEIRYTARLQHPHILPLYDSGEAAGHPFYVTPFIEAGSLRDVLKRRGRLSLAETVELARGVAKALGYAHDRRVLHCDVKPENVLVSDGHAFVSDFGISRAVHAEAFEWGKRAEIDSSAGTPAYVSPEQATGERHLDARSDVYSFGCMVFEMLAGRPPFTGTRTMEIVAQRFTAAVPALDAYAPQLPRAVEGAVAKAMSLPAQRRYPSAAEFATELAAGAATHDSRIVEAISLVRTRGFAWARRITGRAPALPQPRSRTREMIGSFRHDLKYAIRTLARSPGFSAVVVATLAFGIAANTLVFSLINPYFFRALPFGNADRLVQIGLVDPISGWDAARFSLPQTVDWKARTQSLEDVALYYYGDANITGNGVPERIGTTWVSANMFSVLQAPAARGRTFETGEDGPTGANVAIISDGLWRSRFGATSETLGSSLTLDGVPRTIIGIMPPAFNFPFGSQDIWLPMRNDPVRDARDNNGSIPVARMAPGWTIDGVHEELVGIQREMAAQYPDVDGRFTGVTVRPIREALNFAWDLLRISFTVLLGAVAFALLIACVNVASLMLARSSTRAREVAVRSALGASRGRLIRQFLSESLVLAIAGGVLGVGLAYVGARIVGPAIPVDLYRIGDVSIDGSVLLFTTAVTLMAPMLFGLAPALHAVRANLTDAIKDGATAGGRTSGRRRAALVVFEVAMAVVLISGTGLFLRSLGAVQRIDLGMQPDGVLNIGIRPPSSDYDGPDAIQAYFDRATEALAALPGVRAVGTAAYLPLNNETRQVQFARPGRGPSDLDDWPTAIYNRVSPEYFDALGVPILQGRVFQREEGARGPDVLVVNQTLATTNWPGESPVGQTLRIRSDDEAPPATVIGVVPDIRHAGVTGPPRPQVYRAMAGSGYRRRFLVASVDGPLGQITDPARQALLGVDPNLPMTFLPMNEIVRQSQLQWSLSSALLAVFAGGALLLASVGIYGLISYSVAQRQREIGLRIALGATSAQIRGVFLRDGLRMGGAGVVIGMIAAVGVGQVIASLLFGISPFDPVTLVAVTLVFLSVAALASFVPALRASRVDPLGALKTD